MSTLRRRIMMSLATEPIAIIEHRVMSFSSTTTSDLPTTYRSTYNTLRIPCKPSTTYSVHFSIKPTSISRIAYSDEKFDGTQMITVYGFINNGVTINKAIITDEYAKYLYISYENEVMSASDIVVTEGSRVLMLSQDYIEADITADKTNIGNEWTNSNGHKYTYELEYEVTNNIGNNNSIRATNAMTSLAMFSDNVPRTTKIGTFTATGSVRTGPAIQCRLQSGTTGGSFHVKIWNLKIYEELL